MTARGAVRQAFTADELEHLDVALVNAIAYTLNAEDALEWRNLRLRVQHYQRCAAAQEAKRS